jgi:aerobic-type carbon monoxide dehydrogenase small subunit (CoxS/CutS family)
MSEPPVGNPAATPPLRQVTLEVNGRRCTGGCEPRMTLLDFLRDTLGLTGTHAGCEHGVCGACTILMEGASVRSCLLFAVQAEGARLQTVEGLGAPGALSDLQAAFKAHHALQCGFCTPGMLLTAEALLNEAMAFEPPQALDEAAVRQAISGNLCRCTGYQPIIAAILDCAASRRAAAQGGHR